MKKFMVADLVKDLTEDRINELVRKYGISRYDARYIVTSYLDRDDQELIAKIMDDYKTSLRDSEEFYKNYPNPEDWDEVEATAELYGVDITDVDDDMVEAYLSFDEEEKVYLMENGGIPEAKGEIDSTIGKVLWWFNIALGTFMLTTIFKNGNPAQYPISVSELREIRNSDSFGEYFNKNIRGDSLYSDKDGSCGCIGEDSNNPKRLCTSEDFAQMPQEFKAYL
jgi:hypothetical protein